METIFSPDEYHTLFSSDCITPVPSFSSRSSICYCPGSHIFRYSAQRFCMKYAQFPISCLKIHFQPLLATQRNIPFQKLWLDFFIRYQVLIITSIAPVYSDSPYDPVTISGK